MIGSRRTTAAQRVAAVVVGLVTALPLAGGALVAGAAPASASAYRYWTYWWGTDTGRPHSGWKFASQGPASHGVGDGWVLGWRFATSSASGGKTPRVSATYSDLCSTAKPTDGSVRVALVIDYGTASDAPPGEKPPTTSTARVECLVLPSSARGIAAFGTATPVVHVRDQNGLICGLDGYPRSECAPIVVDPAPTPKPSPSRTPTRSASSTPIASTGAGSSSRSSTTNSSPAAVTASTTPSSSVPSLSIPATVSASPPTTTATSSESASAGYPDEATLPAVAGAPASAATEQSSTGPLGLVAGVLVIGGLAGSAWWTSRRGGRTT